MKVFCQFMPLVIGIMLMLRMRFGGDIQETEIVLFLIWQSVFLCAYIILRTLEKEKTENP